MSQEQVTEARRPTKLRRVGRRFLEWYFASRPWERDTNVYRRLGVLPFKKAIMGMAHVLRRGEQRAPGLRKGESVQKTGGRYFLEQSEGGMKEFAKEGRVPETIHVVFALYSAVCAAAALVAGPPFVNTLVVSCPLLVFNVYCVMLQRYNRARIWKALARMKARSGTGPSLSGPS